MYSRIMGAMLPVLVYQVSGNTCLFIVLDQQLELNAPNPATLGVQTISPNLGQLPISLPVGTAYDTTSFRSVNNTNTYYRNATGDDSISSSIASIISTPSQRDTLPDHAAGGLGAYLNQIAAELNADLSAKQDADQKPWLNWSNQRETFKNVPQEGLLESGVSLNPRDTNSSSSNFGFGEYSLQKETGFSQSESKPMFVGGQTHAAYGTGSLRPSVFSPNSTQTHTPIAKNQLIRTETGSTTGVAAAAGGIVLLGGGMCGMWMRRRRRGRTELSRFGSPHRGSHNELPRRFLPV